jgi:hypothetical protein
VVVLLSMFHIRKETTFSFRRLEAPDKRLPPSHSRTQFSGVSHVFFMRQSLNAATYCKSRTTAAPVLRNSVYWFRVIHCHPQVFIGCD